MVDNTVLTAVIAAVSPVACAAVTGLMNRLANKKTHKLLEDSKQNERLDKLEEAMQCILRDSLIGSCEKYIVLGYLPMYVRDNIEHAYKTYHELGGNGAITSLYNQVMALGLSEDGGGRNEEN